MSSWSTEDESESGGVIAFRCPPALVAAAERAAAAEGLTRSDIARRALIYALRGNNSPIATAESAEAR
jgi:hypothetical protein